MTKAMKEVRSEPWGCVWKEQGPEEAGGQACLGTSDKPVWSEPRESGRSGRK